MQNNQWWEHLTPLLYVFVIIAAAGLVISATVHVFGLAGYDISEGRSEYLFFGVFAVFLPTVLVTNGTAREFKQKDWWKAVLRGCPPWMKYIIYGCFAYALFNFARFALGHAVAPDGSPPETSIKEITMMTGHILPFYAIAMGTLYSAIQVSKSDPQRRCSNGHPVSPSASFCDQCGAEVKPTLRSS